MGWIVFYCLLVTVYSFNLDEAEIHLLNSYAAYCQPQLLTRWNCYWCNETYVNVTFMISNVTNDLFGYVGIDTYNNNLVVAFRGSRKTSIANWVENLDFIKTQPYPDMPSIEVHEGFWQSYINIMPQLLRAIERTALLCPQCQSTTYIGHSLGAAISTFAAVDLQFRFNIKQPPPLLFSFGQPRIGNQDWANFYNNFMVQSSRVVHNKDPVPHLPLESMGFYHIPVEYWEYSTRTVMTCDDSGEDPQCSDSIFLPSLDDHYVYLGFDHRLGIPFLC